MRRWMQGIAGLAVAHCVTTVAAAQSPPPGRAVTVNYLANITFAATPVGDFPTTIEMLDGVMNVVTVNGQNMLRASATSSFLIRLPQVLPADFTIEADVIPKIGANPPDIGFEGTPLINQGPASANILWHSQFLQVVGGAIDNFETRFPEKFAAALEGVLTRVTVVVEGPTIKVFTNGRLMSTLPNRKFLRGPVLRVYLGGQDDGTAAVYLAALRLTPTALSAGQVAGTIPSTTPPQGGSGPSNVPAPTPSRPNAGPAIHQPVAKVAPAGPATMVLEVGSRQGWGANVRWPTFAGATQYVLERREAGKPFAAIGMFPENGSGGGFKADLALHNGSHYDYQVKALDNAGANIAVSAIRGLDTPVQYPTITGLASSVGTPQTVTVAHLTQTFNAQGAMVTYTWDASPFIGQQFATFEHVTIDPVTRVATTVRASGQLSRVQPGVQYAVADGTSGRFCIAAIPDPDDATKLAGETCLNTPVPAPTTSNVISTATNPALGIAQPAGPTQLSTYNMWAIDGGWGISLQWDAVPNATGYRVLRQLSGANVGPVVATVVEVTGLASASARAAIDPDVGPNLTYTYWVEALLPNGVVSAPSPISSIKATAITSSIGFHHATMNLKATVSGTKSIVVPGILGLQGSMPGSDVTWTWSMTGTIVKYDVSYEIVGGVPGFGPVFERTRLSGPTAPVTFAPFTRGVPQGATVSFCVSIFSYSTAASNQPLPSEAECLVTKVP